MTEQEIYDSYEFKLVRKILKKEFKWIKDIRLSGDPNRYSTLIFVTIIMDPFECAEEEGLTVAHYIKKNKPAEVMSFPVFFSESINNPLVSNIQDEIENVFKDIKKNPSIPNELKLKSGHRFDAGYFEYLG
jgi:hypothetical protein